MKKVLFRTKKFLCSCYVDCPKTRCRPVTLISVHLGLTLLNFNHNFFPWPVEPVSILIRK